MNTTQIKKTIQDTYNIPVKTIELLRDGSDNTMWTVTDDQNIKYVVRVSKREMSGDIAFEAEWIRIMCDEGVPVVPIVLTKDNKPYTTMMSRQAVTVFRFLQGQHLVLSADTTPPLNAVTLAATALAKLHDISLKHTVDVPRKRTIFSELERIITYKELIIEKIPNGADFVAEVEEQLAWGGEQTYKPVLVHNDYRAGNVMFDAQNNLVAVLDFDWSCIGPAIKDVAHTLAEWSFPDGAEKHNEKVFSAFLDGYNKHSVNPVLNDATLYHWISLSCLSDACTFIIDRLLRDEVRDPSSSFMYKKSQYFTLLSK